MGTEKPKKTASVKRRRGNETTAVTTWRFSPGTENPRRIREGRNY